MGQDAKSPGLPYEIQERKVIAETPNLRAQEMFLAPGEFVPWHYHSNVADTFYCLEGDLWIETVRPGEVSKLKPGESFVVPTPKAHKVSNGGQGLCRFILIQGVGSYDFVPLPDSP